MPLTAKDSPATIVAADSTYPDRIRRLPDDVLSRFASLTDWDEALNRAWSQLNASLGRDRQALIDAIDSLTNFRTSAESSISVLQAAVAALGGIASAADLASLSAQLTTAIADVAAALAALNAHIADRSTHGVAGDIVGTTDGQLLDSKSIGSGVPGYGRFTALIHQTIVPAGESWAIPSGFGMVIAGGLTINGTLVIAGTLAIA